MNRTTIFISSAVVLLIAAIVVGLPKSATPQPSTPAPPPGPVVAPQTPPPPQMPLQPAQTGSLSMNGRLSHPFIATGTSDVFATLDVSAVDVPGSKRAPVNLALVIDRSGSMSGAKIENARRAALKLVDLLGDEDRLSVVHYGNDVRAMNGVFATVENKDRLRRYIRNIVDEGGTNIGDGLRAGQAQLDVARTEFRVNRLLLLSDGQPTVGVTSAQGLANIVATIRARGISVTSLGVGADFNEDLMQRLADVGGGSYGFISNASATAELFARDLKQAGTMVARAASIQFTVPEGVDFVEVYGRPFAQDNTGRVVSIVLPDFSAAQNEKVVVHLRARPSVRSGVMDIGSFKLAYEDLLANRAADTRVSLSASITDDSSVAQARRDKTAVVDATRAQAALNYKKAAEAIDRGDFHGAKAAVNQNAVLFDDADALAGKGSVSEEREANEKMYGLSTSAPTAAPEVQRETVKMMKVQSLKSSGRGASAY